MADTKAFVSDWTVEELEKIRSDIMKEADHIVKRIEQKNLENATALDAGGKGALHAGGKGGSRGASRSASPVKSTFQSYGSASLTKIINQNKGGIYATLSPEKTSQENMNEISKCLQNLRHTARQDEIEGHQKRLRRLAANLANAGLDQHLSNSSSGQSLSMNALLKQQQEAVGGSSSSTSGPSWKDIRTAEVDAYIAAGIDDKQENLQKLFQDTKLPDLTLSTRMQQNLLALVTKARDFAQTLYVEGGKLRDEIYDLKTEEEHIALLKMTAEQERTALLQRGKLAEKLAGISESLPDTDWLYMQLRAYQREIAQQKASVLKTIDRIEEQTDLSLQSEFTKQELEYCDLPGRRKAFDALAAQLESKRRKLIKIENDIEELRYEFDTLDRNKSTAGKKQVELKQWLGRSRDGVQVQRDHRRMLEADQRVQQVIDIVVPWLVLVKNQYNACEAETKDFLKLISHIEDFCNSEERLRLQTLRNDMQEVVHEVILETESIVQMLPKLVHDRGKQMEQALEEFIPERVLGNIDTARKELQAMMNSVTRDIRDNTARLKMLRAENKSYPKTMRHLVQRGMKQGCKLMIVGEENDVTSTHVKGGEENALWWATDRRQRDPQPQIYFDDVISLVWGPKSELCVMRPDQAVPWRCFTIYVYRDHQEEEANHLLVRKDAGKKIKRGERIQIFNFFATCDEDLEFWMLYLHYMCPQLTDMRRSKFIGMLAKMRLGQFCKRHKMTPAKMWRRALQLAIKQQFKTRLTADGRRVYAGEKGGEQDGEDDYEDYDEGGTHHDAEKMDPADRYIKERAPVATIMRNISVYTGRQEAGGTVDLSLPYVEMGHHMYPDVLRKSVNTIDDYLREKEVSKKTNEVIRSSKAVEQRLTQSAATVDAFLDSYNLAGNLGVTSIMDSKRRVISAPEAEISFLNEVTGLKKGAKDSRKDSAEQKKGTMDASKQKGTTGPKILDPGKFGQEEGIPQSRFGKDFNPDLKRNRALTEKARERACSPDRAVNRFRKLRSDITPVPGTVHDREAAAWQSKKYHPQSDNGPMSPINEARQFRSHHSTDTNYTKAIDNIPTGSAGDRPVPEPSSMNDAGRETVVQHGPPGAKPGPGELPAGRVESISQRDRVSVKGLDENSKFIGGTHNYQKPGARRAKKVDQANEIDLGADHEQNLASKHSAATEDSTSRFSETPVLKGKSIFDIEGKSEAEKQKILTMQRTLERKGIFKPEIIQQAMAKLKTVQATTPEESKVKEAKMEQLKAELKVELKKKTKFENSLKGVEIVESVKLVRPNTIAGSNAPRDTYREKSLTAKSSSTAAAGNKVVVEINLCLPQEEPPQEGEGKERGSLFRNFFNRNKRRSSLTKEALKKDSNDNHRISLRDSEVENEDTPQRQSEGDHLNQGIPPVKELPSSADEPQPGISDEFNLAVSATGTQRGAKGTQQAFDEDGKPIWRLMVNPKNLEPDTKVILQLDSQENEGRSTEQYAE